MRTVKELTIEKDTLSGKQVVIAGWVRTNRAQKEFGFLNINDVFTHIFSHLHVTF